MEQRLAHFHGAIERQIIDQIVRRDLPHRRERRVGELQAPVQAKHHHRFVQLLERRFLHLQQRIVLRAQRQLVGDVGKDQQQPAAWVALAHHAQRALIRQHPEILRQLRHFLVERQFPRAPFGVIGVRRQLALFLHVIEPRRVRRAIREERDIEAPQILKRAVIEH